MRFLLLLTISIILVGCGHKQVKDPVPPKPVVVTKYVYPDCGTPPRRDKVEHRDIVWGYIHDENGNVLYTLSPKDYENLSFNTSEIIKGAKQLKGEKDFYKECIKANRDDR